MAARQLINRTETTYVCVAVQEKTLALVILCLYKIVGFDVLRPSCLAGELDPLLEVDVFHRGDRHAAVSLGKPVDCRHYLRRVEQEIKR